ncbi:MAG: hypothetical protein JXB04_01115 [Kiritimatiellae bacterium]|nr:hypothetical protein [Kiritimatiellia bacterium]
MAEEPVQASEAKEADIVFDCPACGKSLAIDARGAGLMISCPKCRQRVQVPLPEGTVTAGAEQAAEPEDPRDQRIRELTQVVETAQGKIQRLVEELEEVRSRRKVLERVRVENLARFEAFSRELGVIQNAIDRIVAVIAQVDLNQRGKKPS